MVPAGLGPWDLRTAAGELGRSVEKRAKFTSQGRNRIAFLDGSGPVLDADHLASAAALKQDQRVPSLGRLVDLANASLWKFPHSKTLPGPSVWTLGRRSGSWVGMRSGLGQRAPRSG